MTSGPYPVVACEHHGSAEAVVGEVGLPTLVGLLGGEVQVGTLWPFLWFGLDQPVPGQDAVDGCSVQRDLVAVG